MIEGCVVFQESNSTGKGFGIKVLTWGSGD